MSTRKRILAAVAAVGVAVGGVATAQQLSGSDPTIVTVTTPDRTLPGETYTFTVPTVTETQTQTVTSTVTQTVTETVTTTAPEPEPEPPAFTVDPPTPPQSYAIPAGAVRCSTSSCLISELAKPAHDIKLANGTYDNGSSVGMGGNRLYAENLGGATLKFGLSPNGSGWRVQGIRFNVTTPSKTPNGNTGAIMAWGGGKNGTVADSWFDGGFGVLWGVLAYANDGMVVERIVASNYQNGAFYLYDNTSTAYGGNVQRIRRVTDLDLSGFAWPTPGASNTYEGGLFVGQPVTEGVKRVRVRDVGRKAVETFGNAWDTVYQDLDLDPSGPHAGSAQLGIYMEHYSLGLTWQEFLIRAGRGVNAEWDNGTPGNGAMRTQGATIRDGLIDATNRTSPFAGGTVGVYLDQGNPGVRVERVTFRGQTRAAFNAYRPLSPSTLVDVTYENVARQSSSSHWQSAP